MAKVTTKPIKKKGGPKKKKKPSLGKIIGGGAKSAIQKRNERLKSLMMN